MGQRLTILRAYQGFHPSLNVDRVVPVVPAGAYYQDFRAGIPSTEWTAYDTAQRPDFNGGKTRYRVAQATTGADGLHLTSVKSTDGTGLYDTALVDTKGKLSWASPVRIEVRAKIPQQQGSNGSWWMKWENDVVGSFTDGEIDGVEVAGKSGLAFFTIHGDNPYGSNQHWQQGGSAPIDADGGFHVYRLDWTDNKFEYFVDDVSKFSTNWGPNYPKPFNTKFYLIMNLAVGFATWPDVGMPDSSTPNTMDMVVDWVLVTPLSQSGPPGLPPAGPHALWNPSTSPTRQPIPWDTATVDNTHVMTLAMIDTFSNKPYVAVADSGCKTYWTDATTPGRLTITSVGFNPGTYTVVCPANAQPSVSGADGPIQIVQPDGSWIDCYAVHGNTISWSGNTGTCTVDGYIKLSNYQTVTGWPVGSIVGYPSNTYTKEGFAACGATVCAGAITAEDKKLGYIAHELALVFSNAGLANNPHLPAMRTDSPQGSAYPGGNVYYHQGDRLAIVPTSKGGPARPDVGWSTMDKMVVDALTYYGGRVMDRTSGGFVIRANGVAEPAAGVTLSSADFAGVMSMTAGSAGKYIFDNLRIVT